jgi:hypothetical protein
MSCRSKDPNFHPRLWMNETNGFKHRLSIRRSLSSQTNQALAGTKLYLLSLPTLTRLTPSKVVFPALSGGVLLRAMMPVSLGSR